MASLRSRPQSMPPRIRVLIVDDDPLARQAIRAALEPDRGMEVCGEAENGEQAVEQAAELDPDLIVMDAIMPELDGVAATRRIAGSNARARVVILSMNGDEELAMAALLAGAWGYLVKGIDPEVLPGVLRRVMEGEAAISRGLATKLLEHVRAIAAGSATVPVGNGITPREGEVLDLLSAGATTHEIARDLGIGAETVRSHVKHLLRKLGVHSRKQAVLAAGRRRAGRPVPPSRR